MVPAEPKRSTCSNVPTDYLPEPNCAEEHPMDIDWWIDRSHGAQSVVSRLDELSVEGMAPSVMSPTESY